MEEKRTIVIVSVTSDIGTALAERYLKMGERVIGTYRTLKRETEKRLSGCSFFYCDINNEQSVKNFIANYKTKELFWDTFISCPSNPLPLKPFFGTDFSEWNCSFNTNSVEQLRILHGLYSHRKRNGISNVVYFAGGGAVNKAVTNFSAYNLGKITLTKMCELLDAENSDMNIFIVGPGWTKTKTHELILKNVDPSSEKYQSTKRFLETQDGTNMDDIFNCIEWLCKKGKGVAGGRNFSVVSDKWGEERLAEFLKVDPNMYKLRRYGNDKVVSN